MTPIPPVAALLPVLAVLDVHRWDLIRVEEPDHPAAEASSEHGSLLLEPPGDPDVAWRVAPVPEVDRVAADGTPATDADIDPYGSWPASEALEAMQVTPWHEAGIDGSGVKVAVFDVQWFGLDLHPHAAELEPYGSHDCFRHRSCELPIDFTEPRYGFEGGGHGVACAQVIRDVAPGVELHLVRVNTLTTLENAVDWAIREEIDLVSMSMSFFNESFYDGTGPINAQVDELAAAGVLMVTSAGNYAREHSWGDFSDEDGDGLHDFPWGTPYLPVRWNPGNRRVQLVWDDFTNCGDTDLDLYAYTSSGDLLGRATRTQSTREDGCGPVERMRIEVPSDDWVYLTIHRAGGSPNTRFDLVARGGEIWNGIQQRSISDPGTHPAALTVGAVRATERYGVLDAEVFSSHGPTHDRHPKPDIAGPDGLTTSIYGPRGFYGTSASTPAVVGALALLMSADPSLDPWQAARLLEAHALRDEQVGDASDTALGAGRARLPPPDLVTRPAGCWRDGLALGALLLLPHLAGLRRRGRRLDRVSPSRSAESPCDSS